MLWAVSILGIALIAGGGYMAVYVMDEEGESVRPMIMNALFGSGAFVLLSSALTALFRG